MPGGLILEIGQTQIPVAIKLTATQIRAVVRRYAVRSGIQTEGRTETEVAEAVLRALLRIVRDGSLDQQRQEELAAQAAALEARLAADNDIVDEPT